MFLKQSPAGAEPFWLNVAHHLISDFIPLILLIYSLPLEMYLNQNVSVEFELWVDNALLVHVCVLGFGSAQALPAVEIN